MRPASVLLLAALLATALAAQAQDARRGRQLYENHCLGCHYEHVHERPPARRMVKSLAQLREEVARRAMLTKIRFTREDLADVVAYLDQSHYHFTR